METPKAGITMLFSFCFNPGKINWARKYNENGVLRIKPEIKAVNIIIMKPFCGPSTTRPISAGSAPTCPTSDSRGSLRNAKIVLEKAILKNVATKTAAKILKSVILKSSR